MPKPIYNCSATAFLKIKEEIRQKSGLKLHTLDDCHKLALYIGEQQKVYISEHTIARFFKVIHSKTTPSHYTLDILSEYCGLGNWDNFYNSHNEEIKETEPSFTNNSSLILPGSNEILLMKYCLEEHSIAPVLKYLNNIVPNMLESVHQNYWILASTIGKAVKTDSLIRKKLIPEIVKNDKLREFFFNYWVDTDGLSMYYADIIKTHYIKYLNPQDINYKKDYYWANSMVMLNYIKTGNLKEFLKTAYPIFHHLKDEFKCVNHVYIYPFARLNACQIIYQYFSQKNTPNSWYEKKIAFIINEIYFYKGIYSMYFNKPETILLIVLAQIMEALYIIKKSELIFTFYKEIKKIIDSSITNDKIILIWAHNDLLKLLYYLHLSLDTNQTDLKNFKSDIYNFSKGISVEYQYDNQFENTYLNTIIQSLYSENRANKDALISNAKNIALNLKNSQYLRQTEILNINKTK
jgi:hypothetical protein